MTRYTTTMPSPVGPLRIAVDERGALVRIDMTTAPASGKAKAAKSQQGEVEDRRKCAHVTAQLEEYFSGKRTDFDLEVELAGTEFQQKAWRALLRIPFGKTRSYQEQAVKVGNPKAMRAVGAANGRNPVPIVVPCHRVLGKDGSLTGFSSGTDKKRWLLEHEQRVLEGAKAPSKGAAKKAR